MVAGPASSWFWPRGGYEIAVPRCGRSSPDSSQLAALIELDGQRSLALRTRKDIVDDSQDGFQVVEVDFVA
jgi:hypothetical protein